jgi:hypothetical protein
MVEQIQDFQQIHQQKSCRPEDNRAIPWKEWKKKIVYFESYIQQKKSFKNGDEFFNSKTYRDFHYKNVKGSSLGRRTMISYGNKGPHKGIKYARNGKYVIINKNIWSYF